MKLYYLDGGQWVEGEPAKGQKYKRVYDSGVVELGVYAGEAQPERITKISVGKFRLRFTIPEKVAIETSADPIVKVLKDDLAASSYIDFEDAALLEGLGYYESVGILAAGRVAELTADGQPHEAP